MPALTMGLIFLLAAGTSGPVLGKDNKEDIISLAERQALIWQGASVGPLCADPPPAECGEERPADAAVTRETLPAVPRPEKANGPEVAEGSWYQEIHGPSIWYPAAILALVGMLISSIVANRTRLERDAARQANRLKSDFLANVSHEIRTPIHAILGFSEILQTQVHGPQQQQYINAIAASGKTLLRLINDLLDLAKIEAGKLELQPTVVALKSIALEIQTLFMQVLEEKHLEFIVDLHSSLPEALYLDEVRLRQILYNLLKNAVKFTDHGSISLAMRPVAAPVDGLIDLEIVVADTGIGIPLEEQEMIFEAFTQRKRQDQAKYAGTGLGLSITKHLVAILGGDIRLRSKEGEGSTFTVVLRKIPLAPDGFQAGTEGKHPEAAFSFDQDSVILIIDAVDSNRMLIREYLRETKLSIIETISVADGIEWCMAIKPDLILLDYNMSSLGDAALVERFNRVKEELNIAVIAMTSASEVGSEEFQTAFTFDGWLKKPLMLKDITEMLSRFLPHSAFLRQEENALFADLPCGYVLPRAEEVEQATQKLGNRLPELIRILVDNMLEQYKENRETFIVNELKAFAKEIHSLSMEFELEFLGLWAAELRSQIKAFDMERIPQTLDLFPELVEMIENAQRRLEQDRSLT